MIGERTAATAISLLKWLVSLQDPSGDGDENIFLARFLQVISILILMMSCPYLILIDRAHSRYAWVTVDCRYRECVLSMEILPLPSPNSAYVQVYVSFVATSSGIFRRLEVNPRFSIMQSTHILQVLG